MTETKNKAENSLLVRVFWAIVVLAFGATIGYFVYATTLNDATKYPFKLGLDLAGGSQLTYVADVSKIDEAEVPELMGVLREVIERRVNVFGVSEPNVQVERSSVVAEKVEQRLIVELPGVTDIDEAIKSIGETPLLEFKLATEEVISAQKSLGASFDSIQTEGGGSAKVEVSGINGEEAFKDTGLTGRFLERAELVFGHGQGGLSNEPIVSLTFTPEGADLFEDITRNNTGAYLAIFLDGKMISSPRINEAIVGGKAIIQGNFEATEARDLVQNLNFGALPVPIKLDSTQSIGSSLGDEALHAGIYAGIVGFILLTIFMVFWYRVTGVVAVIALILYVLMMLALFKFIPVVLTAAGLAGLILSVGLAVDANVLIAERIKEEIREGKSADEAIRTGFSRAWLAIRDANVTSIIAAIILFWFGTSLIKGFALVLLIGVFISMFSAITISRTLLLAIPLNTSSKIGKFLMSSGFSR